MHSTHPRFMTTLSVLALIAGPFVVPWAGSTARAFIDLDVIGVNYDAGLELDTALEERPVEMETEAGLNASGSVNAIIIDDGNEGEGITAVNVNRTDIEADMAAGEETSAAVSPKNVTTVSELESYARATVRSDALVDSMNFTDQRVEVKYREEGQLLALIPITYTVSVTAKADGTVEVKYPWYSIVTVNRKDDIESRAKVAVDNALRARMVGVVRAEGQAQESFSAAEAADVAAQIHAVLQASSAETGD